MQDKIKRIEEAIKAKEQDTEESYSSHPLLAVGDFFSVVQVAVKERPWDVLTKAAASAFGIGLMLGSRQKARSDR
jgi:hypothetical protein